MVQESIDLLGPHRTHLSDGPVQLLFDPEYPDVVYAQHNLGVHCVSLQALFEMFKRTTSNQDDDLLNSLTHTIHQASVSWVVQESLDRSDQSFLEDAPVGVSIIDDVYLGYAIIVMHANMHVTTAELALRSERANGFDIEGADQLVLDKLQPGKTEDSSSSTYSAFSGAPPFTLPPLLTKTGASQRLSTRYASPPPTSSRGVRATKSTQPSMELTAEMLQFVGTTTEGLDKSIKDLISAGNAVQGRLGLQMEEIPRQIEKLNLVSAALDDKSAQMNQFFDERLNSVQKRQHEITSRADHILQKLIDLSQPDLSIYEKQWLEELGRVKQTVGSAAERKSLESRAERLREQLDVLRPDLEQLQRDKESVSRPNSQDRLGEAQRKRIEAALAEESRLVADARAKIAKLQSRIAIASRSAGVVVR